VYQLERVSCFVILFDNARISAAVFAALYSVLLDSGNGEMVDLGRSSYAAIYMSSICFAYWQRKELSFRCFFCII